MSRTAGHSGRCHARSRRPTATGPSTTSCVKSRMDQRTRERLPHLPALARAVSEHRLASAALLEQARHARPGDIFTSGGQSLRRLPAPTAYTGSIWACPSGGGPRADLTRQESEAFWAWAFTEVLRHTGIRFEELRELSHHSITQYRLPSTGELVPLLQIAPSKTGAERLLLVSPELADVLSAIISRIRGRTGAIPLVPSYDIHEKTWNPPLPLLFQRAIFGEHRPISDGALREILQRALAGAGIRGHDGQPLVFTPHDFRRIFVTDAVMNGLPPHIAQVICGHRDISTTMGYKAIYPAEAIEAHRGVHRPPPAGPPQRGIPDTDRGGMGRSSSPTSKNASCPPAPAPAPSARRASTSTPASGARSCGQTPPSAPGSRRSAPTCTTASAEAEREGWPGESRRTEGQPRRRRRQAHPDHRHPPPRQPRHARLPRHRGQAQPTQLSAQHPPSARRTSSWSENLEDLAGQRRLGPRREHRRRPRRLDPPPRPRRRSGLRDADPDTLRYRIWHLPARLARHARQRVLAISPTGPGRRPSSPAGSGSAPCQHPPDQHEQPEPQKEDHPGAVGAGAHPGAPGAPRTTRTEKNRHEAENRLQHDQ